MTVDETATTNELPPLVFVGRARPGEPPAETREMVVSLPEDGETPVPTVVVLARILALAVLAVPVVLAVALAMAVAAR